MDFKHGDEDSDVDIDAIKADRMDLLIQDIMIKKRKASVYSLKIFKRACRAWEFCYEEEFTKTEVLKKFRLWSLTNHPDKREGSTARFQERLKQKDILVHCLDYGFIVRCRPTPGTMNADLFTNKQYWR